MSGSTAANPVPIRFAGANDSDASKVPGAERDVDPDTDALLWRIKMATWQLALRPDLTVTAGATHALDRLPTGFTLWTHHRKIGGVTTGHVDRYLWGHPSGREYRSTPAFKPHFDWLIKHDGSNCACQLCGVSGQHSARPPTSLTTNASLAQAQTPLPSLEPKSYSPISSNSDEMASRKRGKTAIHDPVVRTVMAGGVMLEAPLDLTPEEIAQNSYTSYVQRLMTYGELDVDFKEPKCLDWIVERQCMVEYEEYLKDIPQYNYRAGEVVLFEASLEPFESIKFETKFDGFAVYNTQTGIWRAANWMAGVVTQLPVFHLEFVDGIDMCEYDDTTHPNTCYRIENFPHPDQHPSQYVNRHYRITPSAIRPFSCFGEIIYPRDQNNCHPSLKYALQIASVFSLVDKYRFVGRGNRADLYCRGIYIGAELVTTGDKVRVFDTDDPNDDPAIFQVTNIVLQHNNIGAPRESRSVVLMGRYPHPSEFGYNTKPTSYNPNATYTIPFHRFVGRLLEHDAATIILPPEVSPVHRDSGKLEINNRGLRTAREISTHALRQRGKITAQQKWHWADYRIQALRLSNVNGQEAAYFNPELDYGLWEASGVRGGGVQAQFG